MSGRGGKCNGVWVGGLVVVQYLFFLGGGYLFYKQTSPCMVSLFKGAGGSCVLNFVFLVL